MLRALVQGGAAGFSLNGLSSTFLDGNGNFSIPPYPVGAGTGTVTSVSNAAPAIEFFTSGSPVTSSGTLGFDWKAPTAVAHGGTGLGSIAANSIVQGGLTSTGPFQSIPLPGLSSSFLNGAGAFSVPVLPAQAVGTVTSVALSAPVIEFIVTGSPVASNGTLGFDWVAPTAVAHGGTGMGSFAANSIIQAGLSSTGKFQSIPLTTLSSDTLQGNGVFAPRPTQPIQPGTSSTYLSGQGTFTIPPAQPVQPGTSSTFLNGQGQFTIPPLPAAGTGTVTQVNTGVGVTGGPITTTGQIALAVPVAVSSGGTGMGSFLASSILTAGLTSTGNFQSIALPNDSAQVLKGNGTFTFIVNADLPVAISGKNFSSSTYANPMVPGQTLTDAAPILWNMNSGSTAQVTMGSNRSMGTVANLPVNGTGIVKIIQGGTGLTMTFVSQFKFAGNRTLPTLSSCPGQVDILSVYSDGTNLHASALVNFK